MTLGKIVITLDNSCTGSSANLNLINIYLRSPIGTCTQIYSGGLTNTASGTHIINIVSNSSCVNIPSTANFSGNTNITGNGGIYAAFNGTSTVDLTSFFSGENPNGTWSIFFNESTSSEPCLVSATLVFGNPTVTDNTSSGDNCLNAINWDGSPTCASTNGKTASSNMPGWQGPGPSTFGAFSGGSTCAWNGNNDNDTWIKFIAESNTICVNISGIDQNLQSIVVTDPNTDGDNNPCTGANGGQYWQLVSCPDNTGTANDIYNMTAGTQKNQNHCFSANPGQTYYLVVDGNGGAESPFFINGLLGTQFVLPIDLMSFIYKCNNSSIQLNWVTLTEANNNYFTLLASTNAKEWLEIGNVNGAGNSNEIKEYSYSVPSSFSNYNYFKLKQTDFDGKYTYSKIIVADCKENNSHSFFPNPADDEIILSLTREIETNYEIIDKLGRIILKGRNASNEKKISINQLEAGVYFLFINNICAGKLIKK
jgi:hypothetical protein